MTDPNAARRHGALVGVTASGKSAVALEVARRVPAVEVVSLDSMQVYRGLDIGTAKPTAAERDEVPHHLIDLVEPEDEMTVARFQEAFRDVMTGIDERGHRALLVGGTGLYLRAVIDELDIPGRYPEVRTFLDAEGETAVLYERLVAVDPIAATRMQPTNRRRVLRALEVTFGSGRPFSSYGPGLQTYPDIPYAIVGLRLPRELVDHRIADRYEAQVGAGFVDEVRALAARPRGLSATARQALGYRELLRHLDEGQSLEESLGEAIVRTRRFARRQERWFRRDPRIHWLDVEADPTAAVSDVIEALGWGEAPDEEERRQ